MKLYKKHVEHKLITQSGISYTILNHKPTGIEIKKELEVGKEKIILKNCMDELRTKIKDL